VGKPVIAILGEYDALPGLSQECVPYQKPRQEGGNGHGCGHNLLGVASLAAALAVAEKIRAGEVKGTVRYYGCPAEENGAAKTFMVKAGVFNDADLSLTWHPDAYNGILGINILANIWVNFRFHGKASHAAADPQNGRSALDAVELMNVGTNYLREHIIPEARIHYVITNGGGSAPNVVPPLAESQYIIRAPLLSQVHEIYPRVLDIAKGAALMTGTEMEAIFKIGMSNLLLNDTITDVFHEKMTAIGAPEFAADEIKFAEEIGATFPPGDTRGYVTKAFGNAAGSLIPEKENGTLLTAIMPNTHMGFVLPGSTDVGDVSWVVPTVQARVATVAIGTPGHSWQITAQGKSGQAKKGMVNAAKVMAGVAVDALNDAALIARAKADLKARTDALPYVCPLPADVKPPIEGQF
jgi:aminobenzoyl-glutamate utilization protein B